MSAYSVKLVCSGISYQNGNQIPADPKRETFAQIIDQVCKKYQLTRDQIMKKGGGRDVSWPRFEAIARMRTVRIGGGVASLPRIGSVIGGLDHTSCLHAIRRYEEIMEFKRSHNLPTNTVFLANADQYEAFREYRKKQSSLSRRMMARAA